MYGEGQRSLSLDSGNLCQSSLDREQFLFFLTFDLDIQKFDSLFSDEYKHFVKGLVAIGEKIVHKQTRQICKRR